MDLDWIDAELCTIDSATGNINHVFERGNLSRAAYKYMTNWVQSNFDSKLEPSELWAGAERAWDAMTPENQMALWSLSVQEERNAQDICVGLLATLSEYQGFSSVKKAFREAIQSVSKSFL